MKPTATRKGLRRLSWREVLFILLFGFAWGAIPGVYQRWMARRDYDQRYSKLLELPSSISLPRAHLQRLPGVVGKALWVDFYLPNASDDDKLRAWFVKHDGFTEFKSIDPYLPKPIGGWEAERGNQSLIIGRYSEDGWVHLTLGQKMSPAEANKDLATFPWASEMQESHSP